MLPCMLCGAAVAPKQPRVIATLQRNSKTGHESRPRRLGHIHGDCWMQIRTATKIIRTEGLQNLNSLPIL